MRGKTPLFFPVSIVVPTTHLTVMLDVTTYEPSPEGGPVRSVLFSAKGGLAGPLLVVTGPRDILCDAADRLWDVQGLVRMRGALQLRVDEDVDFSGTSDALFSLTSSDDPSTAYWRILGRMTALGMIAGRGVPDRFVA